MIFILNVCGAWYIGLLYVSFGLIILELVQLSNRLWKWYPQWIRERWAKVKLTLFFLIPILVGAILINGYHAVMRPSTTHVYIDIPVKDAGKIDSMTVVMMSDIHVGEIIRKQQVKRYVEMSNSIKPDMIVMPGDWIDYDLHRAEAEGIAEELSQLQAPLGIFAVNGNHEYRANRFAKWKWISRAGVMLLVDTAILIDNSFYLVGRDDYINKRRAPLQSIIRGIKVDKPVIVLDHQPLSFREASMNRVSLGLYGHTHFGQYWPYSWAMYLVFKCPYGYYRLGPSQFYVSSGLGVAGPPYRVGTKSEMVVLHIRFVKPYH
ncbi:MAG: metallophosphoesterase [Tannerellaceae bacterium]|nr:metallophosphoesterase [Tannerellaceae bacterium]